MDSIPFFEVLEACWCRGAVEVGCWNLEVDQCGVKSDHGNEGQPVHTLVVC